MDVSKVFRCVIVYLELILICNYYAVECLNYNQSMAQGWHSSTVDRPTPRMRLLVYNHLERPLWVMDSEIKGDANFIGMEQCLVKASYWGEVTISACHPYEDIYGFLQFKIRTKKTKANCWLYIPISWYFRIPSEYAKERRWHGVQMYSHRPRAVMARNLKTVSKMSHKHKKFAHLYRNARINMADSRGFAVSARMYKPRIDLVTVTFHVRRRRRVPNPILVKRKPTNKALNMTHMTKYCANRTITTISPTTQCTITSPLRITTATNPTKSVIEKTQITTKPTTTTSVTTRLKTPATTVTATETKPTMARMPTFITATSTARTTSKITIPVATKEPTTAAPKAKNTPTAAISTSPTTSAKTKTPTSKTTKPPTTITAKILTTADFTTAQTTTTPISIEALTTMPATSISRSTPNTSAHLTIPSTITTTTTLTTTTTNTTPTAAVALTSPTAKAVTTTTVATKISPVSATTVPLIRTIGDDYDFYGETVSWWNHHISTIPTKTPTTTFPTTTQTTTTPTATQTTNTTPTATQTTTNPVTTKTTTTPATSLTTTPAIIASRLTPTTSPHLTIPTTITTTTTLTTAATSAWPTSEAAFTTPTMKEPSAATVATKISAASSTAAPSTRTFEDDYDFYGETASWWN